MVILLAHLTHAATCQNDLTQDLNCNGIDARYETRVNLQDDVCAASVDGAGTPYPNADYYYNYADFGCIYPVVGYDADADGMSDVLLMLDPGE